MIRNLTPHPIRVYAPQGDEVIATIEPEAPARLAMTEQATTALDGIPVVDVEYGAAEGLPIPVPGVRLVVSLVTGLALAGQRDDLLVPYREVRQGGTVVGCRALARPHVAAAPAPEPKPEPVYATFAPYGGMLLGPTTDLDAAAAYCSRIDAPAGCYVAQKQPDGAWKTLPMEEDWNGPW